MITQSTPFTQTQLANLLEAYFDGLANSGSAQFVGIQQSDLNSATLPLAVSASPRQTIKQVKGTSFTIPANFFGTHATKASLPALGAAGVKSVRTRDQSVTWADAVSNAASGATVTFAANTVTWNAHGMGQASHGTFFSIVGGALPTGITPYTFYYLTNVTTNTFQLSAAPGGTAIAFTGAGSGTPYCSAVVRSVIDPASGGATTTAGRLNALHAAAATAGMDMLYDCSQVPAAISKDGTVFNIPTSNSWVTAWLAFLYAMFGGTTLKYFEVWNEPNTVGYFNGTTTGGGNDLWSYSAWLKAACSNNGGGQLVVSPSWTSAASAAMGTWLGSDGGSSQIDIVGFHPYRGSAYLGFDTTLVDAYVAQAAANAAGKPVWITEAGESFLTSALIQRAHAYAAAKGIARMYWYNHDIGSGAQASGFQQMQVVAYPDCVSTYLGMVTAWAGKTCTYVNRAGVTGGAIGTNINGVPYIL